MMPDKPKVTTGTAAESPMFYGSRLALRTTGRQVQALSSAHARDGIRSAARIRAMIALWMDDPRLRARIDRVARDWQ
jgi:hypothetical protein